jgi:DNA polymerase-4
MLPEAALIAMLGRASGRHLHALAHNRDPRPIEVGKRRGSIGSQRALGRSPKSPATLDAVLAGLVDRVTRRMRTAGRTGRTVTLRLRFDDFSRATRSATLMHSTATTATWLETGRRLLADNWSLIEERGCTLLGITISGLVDASSEQLELPLFTEEVRGGSLDVALDQVRDRFGSGAVTRAVLVGRHTGLEMPTLPDPGPSRRRSDA